MPSWAAPSRSAFPRYYEFFSTRTFEYRGKSIGNHNHLLGNVDGVDGIKTGYISASGFNIVTSVHRDNRYLVAVVFGGSSAGSRDERMRGLIHDHIAEASVQHTAPLVAEADSKGEAGRAKYGSDRDQDRTKAGTRVRRSACRPYQRRRARARSPGPSRKTKSAPPAYALASATSVPFTLTSQDPRPRRMPGRTRRRRKPIRLPPPPACRSP